MERWSGKIAIVTGASAGIGWAIARDLLAAGMQVIGLARRLQQMESLKIQLSPKLRDAFHPRECDLSNVASIKTAFLWVEQQFGKVHVLINNAGMAEYSQLLDVGNESALKRVIDVNLMGAIYCTKEAFRLMKVAMQTSQEECHVISVNSLLGHTVPLHIPQCGFNLYPVAKHALRATNEVLRRELFEHKLLRLSVSLEFTTLNRNNN